MPEVRVYYDDGTVITMSPPNIIHDESGFSSGVGLGGGPE